MNKYLESTEYIDWKNPEILSQAKVLANGNGSLLEISRNCFEFVRDEIKHSWDYKLNPVTLRASDVLKHATGYCFAKSHLLAALLRANGIPAGLCYQRLTITDSPPFCLHGLNAVYLENFGWYRIDARGNKQGVAAEFFPPKEKLAFRIVAEGEADLPEIWSEPLPVVVQVLRQSKTYQEVADNLPDVELVAANKALQADG
ncbi:transglutaminase-like domain-containing protein [Microbulbifer yueqingensis]|nr:transglutaminase family protein [Microbulbifer yueqingensis]